MSDFFQWWLVVRSVGLVNHHAVVWADNHDNAMKKGFGNPPATLATPLSWFGLSECVGCRLIPSLRKDAPATEGFLIKRKGRTIRIQP